jgi:hypothetical protein
LKGEVGIVGQGIPSVAIKETSAAQRAGIFHHLGGATLAARRLAIPDGDEHIRPIDGLEDAVEIGILATPFFAQRCAATGP